MNEYAKMISGELYMASDEYLQKLRQRARDLCREINRVDTAKEREPLLRQLFARVGDNPHFEADLRCDYGINTSLGDNFYANYDCIILDVAKVTIGNNCMLGPRVSIYTATHPLDAKTRNSGLEYGKAITIGDNVWIGGDTVINPGITIGNNVVIGSGSVVTKDIPDDSLVFGNPAKVIKTI